MSDRAVDAALPVAFRAFLHEVYRAERRIRARRTAAAAAPLEAGPAVEPGALRAELAASLRRQMSTVRALEGEAGVEQAQHLMAASADAVFQDLEWWGRRAWTARPLRQDFPLPEGVDPDVMRQIDALLADDSPDVELAQVHLLALATGFPGRPDDPALVEGYRLRLFRLLTEHLPELADEPDRLFPDAYRRARDNAPVRYLPRVRGWLVAFLVAASLVLVATIPIWRQATDGARHLVEQILLALE